MAVQHLIVQQVPDSVEDVAIVHRATQSDQLAGEPLRKVGSFSRNSDIRAVSVVSRPGKRTQVLAESDSGPEIVGRTQRRTQAHRHTVATPATGGKLSQQCR